jgi:hypothetical protein
MICKRCEQWIPWNSRSKYNGNYCRHCAGYYYRKFVKWGQGGE